MGLNIQDLKLTSPDVEHLGALDDRHANDRDNVAPRLVVHGVPSDAVELAIVCHDPDAPLPFGFTHWTLYGIPADTAELGPDPDGTFRPGPNTFGETGYGGPQPPDGHGRHHYYFWVYALSRPVEGTPDRETFLRDHGDAIIEQNRLVGTYER
ncbi:YbhB/YbcL family Raf kinase inhibitor-like protein [Nitriliruptoraceae bacterium ZYF776]|nr:YbhB/YbcL family Raf kinase inhibitor-like protein [Profundirhabdus halotolerans]